MFAFVFFFVRSGFYPRTFSFPTRNLAGQLSALLTRRGGPIEVEMGNNSNDLTAL